MKRLRNILRRLVKVMRRRLLSISTTTEPPHFPSQRDPNDITWGTYTPPSGSDPIPTYLGVNIDPIAGNRIIRVGDQTAFGSTGSEVGHNYSNNQAWNADGTLIKLNGNNGHILNDKDYTIAYVCNQIPSYAQWSVDDPHKMWGIQNGNQFLSFDITTNTRTVIRTFSNYTNMSFGKGEGRLSNDDKYVCFVGDRNGAEWLITYDVELDSIIAELELPAGDLDWASISNSGQWVMVHWRDDGSAANQGFKRYSRNLTNETHLYDYTAHGDCGYSIQKNEVWVQFRNASLSFQSSERYLEMIKLDTGDVYGLYYDSDNPSPRGVWGGHISCRNDNRAGWAYVSEGNASADVMANEIFAIMLDENGANVVERYGRHNSYAQTGYNHEAKATVNRAGNKILFDSNFHNTTLMGWNTAPACVLEVV